jgi:hypothetical protein
MSNTTENSNLNGLTANKNVITAVIFGFVFVLVTAVVSILSCNSATQPIPDAIVIIGIDRSGSTEVQRPAQRKAAEAATFFADENRTKLGFYAVDNKAVSIQEPDYPEVGLSKSVDAELSTKSKSRSTRTRPLAFWREMQERFGNAKSPIFIAFLTDGGNDFALDTNEITSTLKALAENKNIHVGILGVTPDLLTSVRRDLEPFGKRAKQTVQTGQSSDEALVSDLMSFLGELE